MMLASVSYCTNTCDILGKRPSPPRSASCQRQPWPRREYAASRTEPSTSHQASCRPRLGFVRHWTDCVHIHQRTELDARVLFADLIALLVGEEHVCRKTTLGRVGVCPLLAAAQTY